MIDTETYWDTTRLMGIGIWLEDDGWYLPFDHEIYFDFGEVNLPKGYLRELDQVLVNKTLIFHNAKFDVQVLRRAGLRLTDCKFECTMMMSYYRDEYPPHDLATLGLQEVNMENKGDWRTRMAKLKKAGVQWHQYPIMIMGAYCIADCKMTKALFDKFILDLESYVDLAYYHDQVAFGVEVLGLIESTGIQLDQAQTKEYAEKCEIRMRELRQEIGFDPAKRTLLARKLFSDPPIGLGFQPLYRPPSKVTGKRNVIMDDDQLSIYNHPLCGLVREYRLNQKWLGTYLNPWLARSADDGRVHPNFKQHGTVTGRLSGDLQQIPRDGYLKSLFQASPGCILMEFDFSQIEYRLAAVYADDEEVLKRLREGEDFHQIVAEILNIHRQQAKTVNYLILFGGGTGKLASTLGINWRQAEDFLERYHRTFPGFKAAALRAQNAAYQKGSIKYWSPRVRRFKNSGEYHKAFNSAIQGGCNDIIRIGMAKLQKQGFRQVNQVHDSVWIDLPGAETERVTEICSTLSDWCLEKFDVPFPVEMKVLHDNTIG